MDHMKVINDVAQKMKRGRGRPKKQIQFEPVVTVKTLSSRTPSSQVLSSMSPVPGQIQEVQPLKMVKPKNPSISKLKKDKEKLNNKFSKLQEEYGRMRERYGSDLFNFEKLN
jgi:hypothetical protein